MNALRAIVAVLALAASALAAARLAIPRIRCNVEKQRVSSELRQLNAFPPSERLAHAQEAAAACYRCLALFPDDYTLRVNLARAEHVLGRLQEAEDDYRKALELNQRPEVYTYLGLLQYERGKPDEARRNLRTAAMFDLRFTEWVAQPLQTELYNEVVQHHDRLRSAKQPQ